MIRKKIREERILLILSIAAIVLGAAFSARFFFRLDLTGSRSHTLSAAARKLHEEIGDPVRITYFISKNLADKHPGPAAIEDLLRELEAASRGKIRVSFKDPESDPGAADALGVAPQQMQVVERSESRVALVYTGIVAEYLDRHAAIPAIIGTETLEYEIVKLVRSLVRDRKPVAGLIVGDADKTMENDYRTLGMALQKYGYAPRETKRGVPVDPEVSILFVLGNSALDDYDAYFIDDFVMRGGRVFFAARTIAVSTGYGLTAAPVTDGGIPKLLAMYGVDIAKELVLDTSCLTVPFQARNPRGGVEIRYTRYPHWIIVNVGNVDGKHPITSRFPGLDLFWPSPMTLRAVDGVKTEPLAQTGAKAWLQTGRFEVNPENEAGFYLEAEATRGQYVLAAALSGSFPSAFANRTLPVREGASGKLAPPPATGRDTRIVVVSSADFLTDLMTMSESTFNAAFAGNAADWLSSDDDLIAVKSRSEGGTRMRQFDDPAAKRTLVLFVYAITLVAVPGFVVAWGLARASKRSRLEKESRKTKGGAA
ncbi:MAG: Gldg family protein [Spirochaetes bacterium]|nr:Gldg family protein [Spirochaetota bacterium]